MIAAGIQVVERKVSDESVTQARRRPVLVRAGAGIVRTGNEHDP